MTPADIKNDLAAIARPRPLLMGLLMKDVQGQTLGTRWASILADPKITKQTYLADVLGEFVDRRRLVPDPLDALCDVIQSEANARHWRGWERYEQHTKYHAARPRDFRDDELGRFFAVFDCIRRQPNEWRTKRQAFTDQQMDEALQWVKQGGEGPAWVTT